MLDLESRVSTLEVLFATDPSREWPLPLLQAVADKGRSATAQLEMTFGPWKMWPIGTEIRYVRKSLKPNNGLHPMFIFRPDGDSFDRGLSFLGLHRPCTSEEFDALVPTLKMVCDAVWSIMGARLIDEEVK